MASTIALRGAPSRRGGERGMQVETLDGAREGAWPSVFGARLRAYRVAAGLTQEALAERAGVSVRGLKYLEQGARHPYPDTLRRLAEALALAPAEWASFIEAARAARIAATTIPVGRAGWMLPIAPMPLIGREREVEAAAALLVRGEARLLTLTGPGGVGKTRLALEVAAQLGAQFADDMAFVSLAPLGDPALVPATVAQALGVREAAGQSLHDSLVAHLLSKNLLLVLDNFERVTPAAPLVATLLAACPQLHVLATSRAPLHLLGERLFPVPPLALPDPRNVPPLATLVQVAAVALFVARAQAVKPDFTLTPATMDAVAGICVRLDGLPLAIELAAARIKLLPPRILLERLVQAPEGTPLLQLLTGGPQDLPLRQQTLRGTIAWSYDLLDVEEQLLLARLSVFADSWTLDEAEAICTTVSDRRVHVLDGLTSLADKSLVYAQGTSTSEADTASVMPRFGMLEMIREFALERLAASGEGDALRRQHAASFLALAEDARRARRGPDHTAWLGRLEADHANLRATLAWYQATDDAEALVRLAGALGPFWEMHGHFGEGRHWLASALARSAGVPVIPRAYALVAAGSLASSQGDHVVGRSLIEEGLALCREAGDRHDIAYALSGLGQVEYRRGNYALGRRLFNQSLTTARRAGDTYDIIFALMGLGLMADYEGNSTLARVRLEESLTIARTAKDRHLSAMALQILGDVAIEHGDLAVAHALFQESLAIRVEIGDKRQIALVLIGFASLAAAQGQPERAVRLSGAAATLRETIGVALPTGPRTRLERRLERARQALGPEATAAAWHAGRTWTLDQALVEARRADD